MNTLTKNTALTFSIRILGAALAFILQVSLARMLGVYEYGTYSFVISWISIITLFSTLGFDSSLTRYLPEYIQSKQWSKFHGIIKLSFRTCLIFSILLAILVLFIVIALNKVEYQLAFIYALPLIVIITLTNIRISALKSLKRYVEAIFPETILKPVIILSMIYFYYALGTKISSHDVIIAQIISASITLMIGMFFLNRILKNKYQHEKPVYQTKYWISSSVPMLFITSSAYIISQTDIIMLGILGDINKSGIYSALSRVSEVSVFFMAAVNFVAAPLISEAYQKQSMKKLSTIVWKSTIISSALALLSFIIFVSFGDKLLGIFGGDFTVGYYALVILTIGHLANTTTGPVGIILSLTGNQFYAAKIMGMSALANVLLNYLLIPEYGLIGAALSTMTSTILWNVLMLLKVKLELKINPSIIGALTHEKS